MMQELETGVVALLQAEFTGGDVNVQGFPEMEAEYRHISNVGANVWVVIDSFLGGDEKSFQNPVQERSARVQIVVRSLRLRGENGIYEVIDRVKKALFGKKPLAGCGHFRLLQVQTNGEPAAGEFDYSVFMECPAPLLVEHVSTDIDGPLLTEVNTYEIS